MEVNTLAMSLEANLEDIEVQFYSDHILEEASLSQCKLIERLSGSHYL